MEFRADEAAVAFIMAGGKITQIGLIAGQDRLDRLDLEFLPGQPPLDT